MEKWDMDLVCSEVTERVLSAAFEVHRELGPGLLESTYRKCLEHQLRLNGLSVRCEVPIAIRYKGLAIEASYRADLVVDETVLVELKAVERLLSIHEVQALTYLKLSGLRVALLLNFNAVSLRNGLKRFVC